MFALLMVWGLPQRQGGKPRRLMIFVDSVIEGPARTFGGKCRSVDSRLDHPLS